MNRDESQEAPQEQKAPTKPVRRLPVNSKDIRAIRMASGKFARVRTREALDELSAVVDQVRDVVDGKGSKKKAS